MVVKSGHDPLYPVPLHHDPSSRLQNGGAGGVSKDSKAEPFRAGVRLGRAEGRPGDRDGGRQAGRARALLRLGQAEGRPGDRDGGRGTGSKSIAECFR